ncbi:Xaa-Pro dipeptidyl-peptidase [Kibdelosporangium philippinense]|uniref:Xaa-Pro dipeptidyl-peptidase n=1 Tax=Kibdelosporangium philippinense TaxID=211113 RepID=A0ABS8ZPA8_9PSEU|nr:Xaa-Pro dipeptidyl-peptidase [Kibdelosporangium philippinense]MCE7009604.1 Xaa-Pro dipeptidyl-peptidase [Kibdelosporangium philippinense]
MRRVLSVLAAVAVALPVIPAAASAAQEPVFKDGQAQPVFDPTDVVREKLWVTAPVDSDRDGKDDVVYTEVVRPRATEQGLKVPVVYQISPYFAGFNDVPNHGVDVELHSPTWPWQKRDRAADEARVATAFGGPRPDITSRYEQYLLARGYAVVYAESLGTGHSTGCPTSGGSNETIGAKSVVDWLNGRAEAKDASGAPVSAKWTTGSVGMMGVSYNGTLPNAVASTGVRGLDAIVPIAAISSWYDYYRQDGLVVAPGGYQGEDLDVLVKFVYTRADQEICKPIIDEIFRKQDRVTGDYSAFWHERNYLKDVHKVRAATLVVHGLNDWNVKGLNAEQWYEAIKKVGVPHKIWWHQSGHSDPLSLRRDEWLTTLNRWFTRYLFKQHNGVEKEPRATIQREDKTWVDEAEWPAPGTKDASLYLGAGGTARGTLGTSPTHRQGVESLTDDATQKAQDLVDAASSPNRLSYSTGVTSKDVRLSGRGKVDLRASFSRPAANITALLVDRAPDGKSKIVSRGWTDPQNRLSEWVTLPVTPGREYSIEVRFEPKDYVFAAGHKIEFVLLSSDFDYTLRPKPGAGISIDVDKTVVDLPIVGGKGALRYAL